MSSALAEASSFLSHEQDSRNENGTGPAAAGRGTYDWVQVLRTETCMAS